MHLLFFGQQWKLAYWELNDEGALGIVRSKGAEKRNMLHIASCHAI